MQGNQLKSRSNRWRLETCIFWKQQQWQGWTWIL